VESLRASRTGPGAARPQASEYTLVPDRNDAQLILKAALNILPLRPDIIDVNMVLDNQRSRRGVGMMRDPALVAERSGCSAQTCRCR
jgi:hypothetical protein